MVAIAASGVNLWLTALGVVGSLGLGALVGALFNHRLRERADAARDKRERSGLARLLMFEIQYNEMVRQNLDNGSFRTANLSEFRIDLWKDTRVRLAQLLPSDPFYMAANYYNRLLSALAKLQEYRKEDNDNEAVFEAFARMRRLEDDADAAMKALDKYVDDYDDGPEARSTSE